jgi:hypothetical protein
VNDTSPRDRRTAATDREKRALLALTVFRLPRVAHANQGTFGWVHARARTRDRASR